MEEFVADATMIRFEIEDMLDSQADADDLLFPGMDKSNASVCINYAYSSKCQRGSLCPYRHIRDDRSVVCKHWLRGLCKKGDDCEFLHEYNMSKMPECYFFAKFGQCGNKECPFLHIDPDKKLKDCQWYDRGFCRHGPACKNRHARRMLCVNYSIGFCPIGKNCKYQHPTFDLPMVSEPARVDSSNPGQRSVVCYLCHQAGHIISACPNRSPSNAFTESDNMPHHQKSDYAQKTDGYQPNKITRRPLMDVTCYKCNEKGHYANKCPKGMLAFLSHAKDRPQPPKVS